MIWTSWNKKVDLIPLIIFFLFLSLAIVYAVPTITVHNPMTGDIFYNGQTILINWSATDVWHFQIWYTTDPTLPCIGSSAFLPCPPELNGWHCIQTHPYLPITFNWIAPDLNSSTVRVRVEGHNIFHLTLTNACSGQFSGLHNDHPEVISEPVTDALPKKPYRYDMEARDINGDSFNFSLITFPSGMTINSKTGLISWTPPDLPPILPPFNNTSSQAKNRGAGVGSYKVSVEAAVTDSKGAQGFQSWEITVGAKDPEDITIHTPRKGDAFKAGDPILVNWSSEGVDHFQIWYTTNSSAKCSGYSNADICPSEQNGWFCLITHPYFDHFFVWMAPNITSETVRIRVEGHRSFHLFAENECSGEFSISQ